MKFILRFLCVIFGVYILFIGGLIFAFHNLDFFHEKIELAASKYFGQEVKISAIDSEWSGQHIGLFLGGIVVQDGRNNTIKYAQVKYVGAKLDVKSLFYFWPTFNDVVIEQPKLTLESFSDGSFRFAGKRYQPSEGQQHRSALLINWLLSQKRADLHAGEFLWKHREGKSTLIEKYSGQYRYKDGQRSFHAVGHSDNVSLGVKAKLRGNFLYDEEWDANATLSFKGNTNHLENEVIELSVQQGDGEINLKTIKAQRLVDVVNIIGQGTQLQRWLSQSKMTGELNDVSLHFTGPVLALNDWQFEAKAQEIAWNTTGKAPGFNSINADIDINKQQGKITFLSESSEFIWPQQLKTNIPIDKLTGTINVFQQSDDVVLEFEDIQIETPIIVAKEINGSLKKTVQQPIYLDLTSRAETKDLLRIEEYFPNILQDKFRTWWKNAMFENQVVEGQVAFEGTLKKEDFLTNKSKLTADFKTKNPRLDYGYQQDWPLLTADSMELRWRNSDMYFTAENAKIGDVKVNQADAKLVDLFLKKRVLNVKGDISGQLSTIVDFLQDGPLISPEIKQARQPGRIEINSVEGNFNSDIELSLPINELRQAQVKGKGFVTGGEFQVGDLLTINDVQGELSYTEKTVTGEGIQALIFGGKTNVNVETLVPGAPPKVRISAEGNANINAMDRLISQQVASRFSGSSSWVGFIDIDQQGVELALDSELQGTQINFPKPFSKQSDEAKPIFVNFRAGQNIETQLRLSSDELELQLESFNRKNLLDRGLFLIGDLSNSNLSNQDENRLSELPQQGMDILAAGIDVDLDDWINTIQEMVEIPSQQTQDSSFNERLRQIIVEPENLIVFGKNLGKTNFQAINTNGLDWDVKLNGQYAEGVGELKPFADIPSYVFTFDRLHWPSKKELLERGIIVPEDENIVDADVGKPNTYPIVDIKVQNFRVFDRDFNRLSFQASPNETAWQFNEISLIASGVEIKGTGEWLDNGSRNGITKADINVSSEVGGQMLTNFGLGDFIDGGEIHLSSSLFWRGAPAHFKFASLNGTYNLDIKKGSFPKVDPENGRFLGLMNINALSRRLRLDFVDVFGKGLVFDRLRTEGIFNDGDIVLKEFFIFSPSVYVEALGKVGLHNENYDLQMLVSPQLGGNVALLTALANPAAGAVVWLADRIFRNQLNKIVVYTYNVTGPWASPKVTRIIKEPIDEESLELIN